MNNVNHPPHYQGVSPIGYLLLSQYLHLTDDDLAMECIDFLEANHQYCNFHLGNAIKYLWRCGIKGDADEDLRKALWYLCRWNSPAVKNYAFLFLSVFAGTKIRPRINHDAAALVTAIESLLSRRNPAP